MANGTGTQTTQNKTQLEKEKLQLEQMRQRAQIQSRIDAIKLKTQEITQKVKAFEQAKKAGLPVNAATTLQEVNTFLGQQPKAGDFGLSDEEFAVLPPSMRDLLGKAGTVIDDLKSQGMAVNPEIEIGDKQLAEFLDQAQREYSDFFSGEEKAALQDLTSNLQRNVQLLGQGEEDIQRGFEEGFRGIGEQAAERGAIFSSERMREERELAEDANRAVQRSREALQFAGGQSILGTERALGSERLGQENLPTLGSRPTFTAQGNVGFSGGGAQLGQISGGIEGILQRQRGVVEQQRAGELEQEARLRRRRLEFSGL